MRAMLNGVEAEDEVVPVGSYFDLDILPVLADEEEFDDVVFQSPSTRERGGAPGRRCASCAMPFARKMMP